ncbi:hypothetical protein ONZ45_g6187 [Pleurotus djamor]|nr:hypothetical protein ONZ45_g6187 [Pleurotus djamor]
MFANYNFVVALFAFVSCLPLSFAYFVVTSPGEGSVWREGAANSITWSKGLSDGINSFDIEMNRLGGDGLLLVARNVPATTTSLNVFLQNVPPADDYFLVFLNSTHGVLHTTSKKFPVILSSDSPPSGATLSSPDPQAPTVTVNGPSNPTQAFATTYAAIANDSSRTYIILLPQQAWGVFFGCLFGIFWTLWIH